MKQSPAIPWWDRIKNKLILSLSAVLILSFVLFGLICTFSFKANIIQQISNKNLQLSSSIKDEAESFLSTITNDLSSLANNLGEGEEWGLAQQKSLTAM